MSLLSGILQSQAPAKQDAASAIQTLCLRLTSSSLVEDRRAAILSLRSFAREYKEAVASGGLRGLIGTLAKDLEDVDTVKVVLETLLLLFVKDDSNPESSDDIALWLADEFTQKQDNLTILIDLLENPDFYTRLYTLQLLVAIQNNRPERTQECVFTAPLGVSRLASILDDKRDAIRNEAILLLVKLSDGHPDVQKLIAFENTFERVFGIIDLEGGVDGGIVVQDCLQLLTNLLGYNASNQTLFRESGYIPRLAKLFNIQGEAAPYAVDQRNQNIIMSLGVCRACVVPGGPGTPANQQSFFSSGIIAQVLGIAFSATCDYNVRSEALRACADTVHGNAPLQERFAQLQVNYMDPNSPIDSPQQNGDNKVYVIEGLLDVALLSSSIHAFDARVAACTCLESYFYNNSPIKLHFLRRAIDGYTSGDDDTANILICLMDIDNESRSDPYRIWIASVIFLHLIYDNDEAKELATSVVLGDAEAGEEVVTAIQTIAGNLITALEYNYDARISLAYLMVLCAWLYEDITAVDDFLNEGATVQSLVAAITKTTNSNALVQGLCAFLLGILYEFSTKDSPIPRATLHTILASRLGRDLYINRLTRLRQNPIVRDFEVTPQTHKGKRGLPDVYFNHIFIDFLKDNYGRIFRAIDKDPGQKTHFKISSDGTPNGISLELVDSLKAQIATKEEMLTALQTAHLTLEKRLAQEQQDFKKSKESYAYEVSQAQETLESIKKSHENNTLQTEKQHKSTLLQLENRLERQRQEYEAKSHKADALLKKAQADSSEALQKQKLVLEAEAKRTLDAETRKFKVQLDLELRKLDDSWRAEMNRLVTEADSHAKKLAEDHTLEVQRLHQVSEAELMRVKEAFGLDLHRTQEASDAEITALKMKIHELEAEMEQASQTYQATLQGTQQDLQTTQQTLTEREAEIVTLEKSLSDSNQKIKDLQGSLLTLQTLQSDSADKLKLVEESSLKQKTETDKKLKDAESKLARLQAESDRRIKQAEEELAKKLEAETEQKVKEAMQKAAQTQTELDDLLLVLSDLEEKRKEDKKRLKALNQPVSDDDEDDDEEEEDDDDDDDDDDEEEDDDDDEGEDSDGTVD